MQVVKYRHTRFFAVYDAAGELVAVTVYKRGAQEVVRRLTEIGSTREVSTEASAEAYASPALSQCQRKKKREKHG